MRKIYHPHKYVFLMGNTQYCRQLLRCCHFHIAALLIKEVHHEILEANVHFYLVAWYVHSFVSISPFIFKVQAIFKVTSVEESKITTTMEIPILTFLILSHHTKYHV